MINKGKGAYTKTSLTAVNSNIVFIGWTCSGGCGYYPGI